MTFQPLDGRFDQLQEMLQRFRVVWEHGKTVPYVDQFLKCVNVRK